MKARKLPATVTKLCVVSAFMLAFVACGSSSSGGCGNSCPPPVLDYLYAGSQASVEMLTVNTSTGALGAAVSAAGPQTPGGMVADPASKFLYVPDAGGKSKIYAYSIDASNGTLTPGGTFTCTWGCGCPPSSGSACFVLHLAMTPNGKFLYSIHAQQTNGFCCVTKYCGVERRQLHRKSDFGW